MAAGALPLSAQHWIKLTTTHFELLTDNSKARAAEALNIFEQARAFFDENGRSPTVSEEPTHIIAFQSEREFRPYSPIAGANAYYQHARYDYIVMQDLTPASYPIAIHEYTHLYLAHRGFNLPPWLNEGLADVYSTLQSRGSQLVIGAPVLARMAEIHSGRPLLDLHLVTTVDRQSRYYNQPGPMSQFYAESWAVAHMLFLGNATATTSLSSSTPSTMARKPNWPSARFTAAPLATSRPTCAPISPARCR